MSGARRRPTDPATPEEIDAALRLLYPGSQSGGQSISLEEADRLANNPKGWAAINSKLPVERQMYPEYFVPIQGAEAASCAPEARFGYWEPYNSQRDAVPVPCPVR